MATGEFYTPEPEDLDAPYTDDVAPGAGDTSQQTAAPPAAPVTTGTQDQGGDQTAAPPVAPASSSGSGSAWHVGAVYNTGDLCTYEGQTYQCRQSHTVQAPNWTPPNTLDLWLPVQSNEWAQGKTYTVGETCTYQGTTYVCRQGHTAYAANWTPPNTLDLWSPQ